MSNAGCCLLHTLPVPRLHCNRSLHTAAVAAACRLTLHSEYDLTVVTDCSDGGIQQTAIFVQQCQFMLTARSQGRAALGSLRERPVVQGQLGAEETCDAGGGATIALPSGQVLTMPKPKLRICVVPVPSLNLPAPSLLTAASNPFRPLFRPLMWTRSAA